MFIEKSAYKTAKIFISMIDDLKQVFDNDFEFILERSVGITMQDIENLNFDDYKFKELLDFYLKTNSKLRGDKSDA